MDKAGLRDIFEEDAVSQLAESMEAYFAGALPPARNGFVPIAAAGCAAALLVLFLLARRRKPAVYKAGLPEDEF